jgi:DNA-directed RNA polymerase specialized sigma54-like protein
MVIPGGEKFTDEQLDEFLDRKDTGKPLTLAQVRKKIQLRVSTIGGSDAQ